MTITIEIINAEKQKSLFSEYIKDFLVSKEIEEGRSPATIEAYNYDLQMFLRFQGDIDVNSPKIIEQVREFLKKLSDKNYTKRALGRKIACLKSFFNFLDENDIILKNLMRRIKSPKIKREESLPKFLDLSDIKKILKISSDRSNFRSKKWPRYYLTIRLLYSTMARVSELSNIKVKDVDFEKGYIRLRGKGNKERIVPVDDKTIEIIKVHLHNRPHYKPEDYLLVNSRYKKLSTRTIQQDIRCIKKMCGFPDSKIITPHIFRHSGATHLRRAGMDISELKDILGHSDIKTTMIYAKNDITQIKKSYSKMHPLNKDLNL